MITPGQYWVIVNTLLFPQAQRAAAGANWRRPRRREGSTPDGR